MWVLLAMAALYGAYALYRSYRGWLKAEPSRVADPEDWRPAPATARRLLEDSDALAARGRYAEAVHLLLLRSIEDIEAQRPHLLRPTFTSREIGRLEALPSSARSAFGGIAAVVERAVFAETPIDASAFMRCRKEYEAFAFPGQWRTGGAPQ